MRIASRWQPLIFAALASLALAGFAAYDLYRERDIEISGAKSDTANLARLLEAHTAQTLRRVEARLGFAAGRIGEEPAPPAAPPAALQADLRALLPADGLVQALVWLSADGRVLASSLTQPVQAGARALLQDWLARQRAQPEARMIFGRLQQVADGVWQLPIGRALPAAAGAQASALVALVDTASLQPVLDAVDTGRNGFVTLFLTDGWMLATSPHKPALFAKSWFDSPMFKQHLPRAPADTVQQVVVRDGTERIYSYRRMAAYPLVVTTGISMTDALADWRQRVAWTSGLLAAVCVALLLAAGGMARSIGRREAAERAAAEQARQAQTTITQARDNAQHSALFLRAITDNLPLHIAYVDKALRFGFVNQALSEHLGLPREAIIGKTRREISDTPLPAVVAQAAALALSGQPQQVVYEEQHRGRVLMIEAVLVPDRQPDSGPDGEVLGFYLAATDVTERQAQQARIEQALAERETLLREVYHRVKNNLQVIQSLLSLQRRTLPEGAARAALNDSIQRVQAMALVHEKLYQTGNLEAIQLPDYTADLLRHLGEAADVGRRRINLRAHIDPLEAPLQEAVPYGLLITELVMNSLKHAFPDGRSGSIDVRLTRTPDGPQLVVQDDGIGLPDGFSLNALGASMGLQLAISLAQQLGGDLQAEPEFGAHFSATLARLDGR